METPAFSLRWKISSILAFFSFFLLVCFFTQNQQIYNTLTVNRVITGILPVLPTFGVHYRAHPITTTKNTTGKSIPSPSPDPSPIASPNHIEKSKKKCDIFDGKWIYDPRGSPLYKVSQCPFLGPQVSCQRNNRPDSNYEKWRWEANNCEIPRFDGKDMLERMRNKRLIIVGDSLNRNQFESLACLLYTSISPMKAYVNVKSAVYKVFKAKEYNCTVEFYWSPFLVDLDETDPATGKILKLDALNPSAQKWRDADIMVFNSGHWWTHVGKMKSWDLFRHEGKIVESLDLWTALTTGMKTWAHWVDRNVDPAKTTVFFRSISPEHKGHQSCYNKTQPNFDESYNLHFSRPITEIVERTTAEMKTPVRYLNITKLSNYRRDAHPSIYTRKSRKKLSGEQKKLPQSWADCSHWCVPGIPDTWNSLLYASIILESSEDVL